MKRILWNLSWAVSMLLMISAVQYVLTHSPLGIMVWAGTASWKQVTLFLTLLLSPAVVCTELLLRDRR